MSEILYDEQPSELIHQEATPTEFIVASENPASTENIKNWPEGEIIQDRSEKPNKLLMNDLNKLISENRWDLEIVDEMGSDILMLIDSKDTEYTKRVDARTVIDSTLASVSEGEVTLNEDSGYTEEFPFSDLEGDYIFRGISVEEMWDILEKGRIQSTGQALENIAGETEGTTYFTNYAEMAKQYAEKPGRVPCAHAPTIGQANYLIAIKTPDGIDKDNLGREGLDDEIGITNAVDIAEIAKIVEIRPFAIKNGVIPLVRENGGVRPDRRNIKLWEHSPEFSYGYKTIEADEVMKKHKELTS